jgi:hypothetical protein
MLQFEYTPTNPTLYDRFRCPKCITQMYLAQIKPDQPGFDLRTFICQAARTRKACSSKTWGPTAKADKGSTEARSIARWSGASLFRER